MKWTRHWLNTQQNKNISGSAFTDTEYEIPNQITKTILRFEKPVKHRTSYTAYCIHYYSERSYTDRQRERYTCNWECVCARLSLIPFTVYSLFLENTELIMEYMCRATLVNDEMRVNDGSMGNSAACSIFKYWNSKTNWFGIWNFIHFYFDDHWKLIEFN